ncbi:hypothetical protein BYT27DRAFT_7216181 [Phlegmacium glaucopus]|nr:hypothetical protein BYT27DRAFT_7216181 [Phlegmacium glaucopus]
MNRSESSSGRWGDEHDNPMPIVPWVNRTDMIFLSLIPRRLVTCNLHGMSETQLDERASAKRGTTYPRNHPTENPKPLKRMKAEIQQAAKEKKEAELAKKVTMETQKRQKFLDAEEKCKLSAQWIASLEDAVQRSQKERTTSKAEIEPIVNPAEQGNTKTVGEKEKGKCCSISSSDCQKELTFSNIQEKEKLQAEVQAHRQVAPIVYAHPDPRLLDREKDEQRKKLKYVQVWVGVAVLCHLMLYSWLTKARRKVGTILKK